MPANETTFFSGGRLLWRGEIATTGGPSHMVEFDLSETEWDQTDIRSVADAVGRAIKEAVVSQNGKPAPDKPLGRGLIIS